MPDWDIFRSLAQALALGMLVGVERYKARREGDRKSAGVRTFTIISLLGFTCSLFDQPAFTSATFVALAAFLCVGYFRRTGESVGLTTEFAALLVFWLGYLLRQFETLAVSTAIILTIVLASKQTIHHFVRERVTETEFYDTLKFLAVVFVVFPLLPNRDVGPYGLMNPAHTWFLIILVSSIGFCGYVLMRWLGGSRGLRISGLVGGLISTTAVTMSLAERSRRTPAHSYRLGVAGVMANAVQFPRLFFLIIVVDHDLGLRMAPALLGMGAVGLLGAWIMEHVYRTDDPPVEIDLSVENPYSLAPALKFGAFFVMVSLLTKLATRWCGSAGIYAASALAGTADVSAISLSVSRLSAAGDLGVSTAALAVLLAAASNAVVKWLLALINGTRELAWWLGIGFLTMLGTGLGLLYVGLRAAG